MLPESLMALTQHKLWGGISTHGAFPPHAPQTYAQLVAFSCALRNAMHYKFLGLKLSHYLNSTSPPNMMLG